MFDYGAAMSAMLILLVVVLPFGIWKMIEVVIWIVTHIKITT